MVDSENFQSIFQRPASCKKLHGITAKPVGSTNKPNSNPNPLTRLPDSQPHKNLEFFRGCRQQNPRGVGNAWASEYFAVPLKHTTFYPIDLYRSFKSILTI